MDEMPAQLRRHSAKKSSTHNKSSATTLRKSRQGPLAPSPAPVLSNEASDNASTALETFREFNNDSEGGEAALVQNLTKNKLLRPPRDWKITSESDNNSYSQAEAETSKGILPTAAHKVAGKWVADSHGSTTKHAKGKEDVGASGPLSVHIGNEYFALPDEVKKTSRLLLSTSVNELWKQGLAYADVVNGIMQHLIQEAKNDGKGCPSILACVHKGKSIHLSRVSTLNGGEVWKNSRVYGKGFHNTKLILTSQKKVNEHTLKVIHKSMAASAGGEADI
ncbi:hypothetical protein GYMLUDRAFT_60544 [Collybiopsis luxurians FD-317 M1]|uniref:Uncharacterized protein n=1 Tax=Collybiopsis luxurians FD-317 M1 TaxID=944289 RepID=A0A0D0C8G5_9AGAR|nr:hypothetical protein GYMLUDRAFT_60544 [Collybiopsis luxurians FD-317 M1]